MTALLVQIARPMLISVISIGVEVRGAAQPQAARTECRTQQQRAKRRRQQEANRSASRRPPTRRHATQHDPFTLCEIQRTGAFEDDIEADGDKRIDASGANAGEK